MSQRHIAFSKKEANSISLSFKTRPILCWRSIPASLSTETTLLSGGSLCAIQNLAAFHHLKVQKEHFTEDREKTKKNPQKTSPITTTIHHKPNPKENCAVFLQGHWDRLQSSDIRKFRFIEHSRRYLKSI